VVSFLAITIGQAVGSPLAGWIIARTDYVEAFAMFATLALVLAATSFFYPRPPAEAIVVDPAKLPAPPTATQATAVGEKGDTSEATAAPS